MKKKPQRTGLGMLLKKSDEKQATKTHGVQLSDVKQVTPATLRANPLNSKIFQTESPQYFETLTKDIQERGILVPLIAKENGMLLAGHNRLHIAKKLQLKTVPVQYVEDDVSAEEERNFVIKDNLLRRHLKPEQRIELYRQLYPNFDERIIADVRGGDRKSSGYKKNQSGNFQIDSQDISQDPSAPLSAPIVAEFTGQNVETVRKDFQKHRAALASSKTASNSKNNTTKIAKTRNSSDMSDILVKAKKYVKALEIALQKADKKTKMAILKELRLLVERK
jgi:hypothetical protein